MAYRKKCSRPCAYYHDRQMEGISRLDQRQRISSEKNITCRVGVNQNHYTFALIFLIKITLCSKFHRTKLMNYKCFHAKLTKCLSAASRHFRFVFLGRIGLCITRLEAQGASYDLSRESWRRRRSCQVFIWSGFCVFWLATGRMHGASKSKEQADGFVWKLTAKRFFKHFWLDNGRLLPRGHGLRFGRLNHPPQTP